MSFNRCFVRGCSDPTTHTTAFHTCSKCSTRGHGATECSIPNARTYLECMRCDDALPLNKRCTVFNCCSPTTHSTELHRCHFCGDNHPEKDCPESNIRIEGDIHLDCPICRTNNIVKNDAKKVFIPGDTTCSVCLMNPIEVMLPNCGHVCLCMECCKRLDKEEDELEIVTEFGYDVKSGCKFGFQNQEGKVFLKFTDPENCHHLYVRRESSESRFEGLDIYLEDDIIWDDQRDSLKRFTYGYREIRHEPNNIL